MGKYQLVNPVIIGTFSNTYDATNPSNAAKKFWENLTSDNKYITGDIPKFLFTMKNENNKLHHFMVKEKLSGRHADYTISELNVNLPANKQKKFMNASEKVANKVQSGGGAKNKRYDDDSSSDEDINDLFNYVRLKKAVRPITYWWYTPSIYNDPVLFTPSFVAPISPYIQLWLPSP